MLLPASRHTLIAFSSSAGSAPQFNLHSRAISKRNFLFLSLPQRSLRETPTFAGKTAQSEDPSNAEDPQPLLRRGLYFLRSPFQPITSKYNHYKTTIDSVASWVTRAFHLQCFYFSLFFDLKENTQKLLEEPPYPGS